MKSNTKELVNKLAEDSNLIIASPQRIAQLQEQGIPFEHIPAPTLRERFDSRLVNALEVLPKLPELPPFELLPHAIKSLYEEILDKDKNNPTVINELGDLCLKAGDTAQAVRHFLNAAAKYRQTGLLNNAVAIYKKILRYEAENQNAHWYLAETRAGQGLAAEGEDHALHFLQHSGKVAGDIKEIFLKRCLQLQCKEGTASQAPVNIALINIFLQAGMCLCTVRLCRIIHLPSISVDA